jgi:uncharacterized protein YkwD
MNMPALHGNWVDLVIILIILLYVVDSIGKVFWFSLAGFISFLLTLLLSLKSYPFFAAILRNNFSLPYSFSNALGFFIAAVLIEAVIFLILSNIVKQVPKKFWKFKYQRIFNFIPAIGEALVLIAFILSLALALPIPPSAKEAISSSKIGGLIVQRTGKIESDLNDIFGGVVEEGLNYLTVGTESSSSIPIKTTEKNLSIDYQDEAAMVVLVNQERAKVGLKALSVNEKLTDVARNYAKDMWERGYFSHYSPEGQDVADRLNNAGIPFQVVGENLALAPTLLIAHNGLMNSPGHRANILDPDFNQIGIGIIDNGFYGKIFVQIFTN